MVRFPVTIPGIPWQDPTGKALSVQGCVEVNLVQGQRTAQQALFVRALNSSLDVFAHLVYATTNLETTLMIGASYTGVTSQGLVCRAYGDTGRGTQLLGLVEYSIEIPGKSRLQ